MRYVVILLMMVSFCVSGNSAFSQTKSKKVGISGTVVDSKQNPVIGAMVFIDNNKTDYTTDANGFYRIKVSSKAKTISIFTLTGLITEESINGRTVINFIIKGTGQGGNINQNTGNSNEGVNVGYGTVNKGDLTSNVGKIDGQNPKYASYKNIYDMIRGEVPGVQVVGTTITIQGPTSINLSSQPLFVVDGVVVQSVDDIRPQLVKSIEILKGSSASIYGARGANGVILITLIGAEKRD